MYQNFSSQRSDRILTRDAELLRRSVGCLCEVRSVETNAMVLLGRIRIYDGEILTIVSASGRADFHNNIFFVHGVMRASEFFQFNF